MNVTKSLSDYPEGEIQIAKLAKLIIKFQYANENSANNFQSDPFVSRIS